MNTISQLAPHASGMTLDEKALKAAGSSHLDEGAVTPAFRQHRDDIVRLLNDALATELVCVLRYKRHHFTAHGMSSPAIAAEFMVHANEETAHADLIARRIVQQAHDVIAMLAESWRDSPLVEVARTRGLEGLLVERHARGMWG